MRARRVRSGRFIAGMLVAIVGSACVGTAHARSGPRDKGRVSPEYYEGRALFLKEWKPNEPGGTGDGLGPLYNETSCVGCHNQGGAGGGGSAEHDVRLLAVFPRSGRLQGVQKVFRGELADLHPGLRDRTSVVLHASAVSDADGERLDRIRSYASVQTRSDLLGLSQPRRNTPALFGVGLIDRVADRALLRAEKRRFDEFPDITGRVSRLSDGRIGRFGLRGQVATLDEFVLAACANELGLEVPGHHQASLISDREFDPSKLKLDLYSDQCGMLTNYVAALPRPEYRPPANARGLALLGQEVFARVGCATCHTPALESVDGIYSDLLLHDMGERFQDSGAYYGGPTPPVRLADASAGDEAPQPSGPAAATEWRTAPLWGVADSPPYLHDGRAQTLHEAIGQHGGEAQKIAERYRKLGRDDQQALLAFLHSLRAPKEQPAQRIAGLR